MQDCHPAVVYQPKKSLSGAFLFGSLSTVVGR